MMSGSKELCGVTARIGNNEKAANNDVTYVLQKNMRSMHSSERIEELVCELEGYRWDALMLCESVGMTKKRYGRHNTNTFSWEQENTTTNTELVFD